MKTTKAVITAAAPSQRLLPLQTLVDRDGARKSVLGILIDEACQAGIEEVCVVVCPGDEDAYRQAAEGRGARLHFLPQREARGYGHALHCAKEFVGREPFLHLVGDHVYLSRRPQGCAQQLVAVAQEQACAVSSVQPTREHLLPYFGAVAGQRVPEAPDLYRVERVIEKPTPTEAEVSLTVPGLRAGQYLCLFGTHVLTPTVMDLLDIAVTAGEDNIQLSPVLDRLAERERYLAFEVQGRRYPVDEQYGLLIAQAALALSGPDREEVLTRLLDLMAQREMDRDEMNRSEG